MAKDKKKMTSKTAVRRTKKRKNANKKRGQPTKYKKRFCKMLIDFFDIGPYEKIEIPHYQADGKTLKWMDYKLVPARMPSLLKFAKKIGVSYQTIKNWVDENHDSFQPEFFEAFTCAKEIRKDWIIDLGLSGLVPPLSYKFTAINVTDMRDTKDIEIGGDMVVKFNISKHYDS